MKSKYIFIIGLLTAAFASCNSGVDQKANQNNAFPSVDSFTNLPATNAAVPANPSDSNTPTSTPAKPANAALNPAHGQPGHNCNIAVGAPLPSSATNNTTPQTSTTPAIVEPQNPINNSQPQLAVPTQKTTSGLNPAHGQPGHRCDVAVGAPLNSKATTTTTAPINLTNPANTTADTGSSSPAPLQVNVKQPIPGSPNNVSLPQSATNSKVRLNPAHGQPGHDCKIPVGKPLNQ